MFREFPKSESTPFFESAKRLERLELSVAVERLERAGVKRAIAKSIFLTDPTQRLPRLGYSEHGMSRRFCNKIFNI